MERISHTSREASPKTNEDEILLRIQTLYDPKSFHACAETLGNLLREYYEGVRKAPLQALPWEPPVRLVERARALLNLAPEAGTEPLSPSSVKFRMEQIAKEILKTGHRTHSPHSMGHQVAPGIPFMSLMDALGSATNQPSGIYEMGPFEVGAERVLVDELAARIGWKKTSDSSAYEMIVTHGGSLANLTAILAARNHRYPSAWEKGVLASAPSGLRPAILAGADAHYSVSRSAGISGLGTDQIIKVPLDEKRRMIPSELEALISSAKQKGLDPFCIVASSGSTATGSFDPLEEIAAISRRHGLWLHVDGAHGASLLLSAEHRAKLKGIELADSITWDAHKMMFAPALCTFLLYRDGRTSYEPFHQDAPYLLDQGFEDSRVYDFSLRTMECTRRALALGTYAVWATFGPSAFEALIDRTVGMTRAFYALLNEAEDFTPLHEPECNILCFKYLPAKLKQQGEETISAHQSAIRRKLVEGGEFYITSTRLGGGFALRVTLMNALTDESHLRDLMDAIRRVSGEILSTNPS